MSMTGLRSAGVCGESGGGGNNNKNNRLQDSS
jgi:hypothetical protein